jgi:hypothetical protein
MRHEIAETMMTRSGDEFDIEFTVHGLQVLLTAQQAIEISEALDDCIDHFVYVDDNGQWKEYQKPNASVSISGDEPEYAPRKCSVSAGGDNEC